MANLSIQDNVSYPESVFQITHNNCLEHCLNGHIDFFTSLEKSHFFRYLSLYLRNHVSNDDFFSFIFHGKIQRQVGRVLKEIDSIFRKKSENWKIYSTFIGLFLLSNNFFLYSCDQKILALKNQIQIFLNIHLKFGTDSSMRFQKKDS